jgi:DNA-binding YbaB/EbfC family protein
MFKDLNKIMKQAQELQKNLQRAQEELAQLQVTGEVAGGAVKITMTGKYDVIEVKIDSSLRDPDSLDMLEELVEAALKDALEKIKAATEEKLGSFRVLGTDFPGIF